MLRVLVFTFILLLTACGEQNPVLKKNIRDFHKFLQRSEYARLAKVCSAFYTVKSPNKKARRVSAVCASFSRELSRQAKEEGFIAHAHFKYFRDPRLWQRWRDYMKAKHKRSRRR